VLLNQDCALSILILAVMKSKFASYLALRVNQMLFIVISFHFL